MIQNFFRHTPNFDIKFAYSFAIIIGLWVLKRLGIRLIQRQVSDIRVIYRWQKAVIYTSYLLSILLVGRLWFQGIQSLATFLGLLTAGLAIALKDLITNMAGWVYIIWQNPFELGDRVQVADTRGDVIDIGVLKFTVLEIGNWVDGDQSTGRVIQLPNAEIFTKHMANDSKGFAYIWHEIPVLLTFSSDWRKAKKLFGDLISRLYLEVEKSIQLSYKRAEKKHLISYKHLTPIIYTSTKESGVLLTIRFLAHTKQRRRQNERVWELLLDIIEKDETINLAYPSQKVFIGRD
jgi:small-conductance mechanosensitive channel